MKTYYFTLVLVFLFFNANAQFSTIVWQKTIGCNLVHEPHSFLKDKDGNYLIAGQNATLACNYSGTPLGQTDGWIVKLDSSGNSIWAVTLGGTKHDNITKIIQCTDGGYLAVGNSESSLDSPALVNKGDFDVWVVKLSGSGIVTWQQNFGGSAYEQANGVVEDKDGNYWVIAETSSSDGDVTNAHGSVDAWLLKIGKGGNLLWQKTYGSNNTDQGEDILCNSDGTFMIAGRAGAANGDIMQMHSTTNGDAWLYKIDTSGNILWSKTYGGSDKQSFYKLIKTSAPGFLLGGSSNSHDMDLTGNYGDFDFWLVKVNDTGKLEWQKNYGGSDWDPWISAIIESKEGGYLISGTTTSSDFDATGRIGGTSDILCIKTDDTGAIQWKHIYGGLSGESPQSSIYQDADSNYTMLAIINSGGGDITNYYGDNDAWIFKLGRATATSSITPENFNVTGANVYPTVTNDVINVKFPSTKTNTSIKILNQQGQIVKTCIIKGNSSNIIHINDLPQGMYILEIIQQGTPYHFKIFKED